MHIEITPLDNAAADDLPMAHIPTTREIEVRGIMQVPELLAFADEPIPDDAAARQRRCDEFGEACMRLGVHYYGRPRELFSMREALIECAATSHSVLVVEDMS